MFDSRPAWSLLDGSTQEPLHWFTFIGETLDKAPSLLGSKSHRKWNQVLLVSPRLDTKAEPSRTRIFVDFFLHGDFPNFLPEKMPLVREGMRLAYDNSGCSLGPFAFDSLQRRSKAQTELFVTIRMGFVELDDPLGVYVYVPLSIHSESPRAPI